MPRRTRREFLRLAAAGAAGFGWPAAPRAEAGLVSAVDLAGSLVLFSGAGGNVVACRGPDGLVLVNGGSADRSAALLAALEARFPAVRVDTLFNTDWHAEHTGSNVPLGRAGAAIVAHEHTKQYLRTRRVIEWQHRTYPPLGPEGIPGRTFRAAGAMMVGGERIEYGHLGQAHTDGDIYVFFRTANVLVVGDVLGVGAYPIADYTSGGWLVGLLNATKTLLDLAAPDTRVVPGTGPVQTRAALEAQHAMLGAMRERFVRMIRQGMGPEDMLAAGVTSDFDGAWGSPELFVATSYRGLWLHVRELGGIV